MSSSRAGIGSPKLSAAIVQFSTCSTRRETIAVTTADTSESAIFPRPGTGRVNCRRRPLVITTSQCASGSAGLDASAWTVRRRNDGGLEPFQHRPRTSCMPEALHTVSLSPGRSTRKLTASLSAPRSLVCSSSRCCHAR